MKRLSAVLFLGFFVSSLCLAQIQTGNASFNPSKTGLTISHPSLSFNTRVRVTNLRNNLSVEAVVNNRIPITNERIADISREAGAALGMDQTGLTPVEIEVLPHVNTGEAATVPVPAPVPAAAEPQPTGTAVPREQAPPPPAQGQTASSSDSREQTSSSQITQILPVQTVTDVQYVPVPGPAQSNCCNFLLWIVLFLLLLVIIILVVILALILRRLLLWPWHYPVWYRRHLLYAKKRRRETAP
jgi:hypothetical protein